MKKKTETSFAEETGPVLVPVPVTSEYFRMKNCGNNLFCLETITVDNDTVVKTEKSEETFIPIVFDMFRRKAGEEFFRAVEGK